MAIPERPSARHLARPAAALAGPGLLALAAIGGIAGTLVVGLEPRDAPAARWCVVAAVATVLATALASGRGRHRCTTRTWLGTNRAAIASWRQHDPAAVAGSASWLALALGVTAWDLTSFFVGGAGLPTLSHLVGHLTDAGWGRSAVFAAWLAWGAWGAVGWRRP